MRWWFRFGWRGARRPAEDLLLGGVPEDGVGFGEVVGIEFPEPFFANAGGQGELGGGAGAGGVFSEFGGDEERLVAHEAAGAEGGAAAALEFAGEGTGIEAACEAVGEAFQEEAREFFGAIARGSIRAFPRARMRGHGGSGRGATQVGPFAGDVAGGAGLDAEAFAEVGGKVGVDGLLDEGKLSKKIRLWRILSGIFSFCPSKCAAQFGELPCGHGSGGNEWS